MLHHVTMAYDIDAAKMSRVLNTSREKMSDKAGEISGQTRGPDEKPDGSQPRTHRRATLLTGLRRDFTDGRIRFCRWPCAVLSWASAVAATVPFFAVTHSSACRTAIGSCHT